MRLLQSGAATSPEALAQLNAMQQTAQQETAMQLLLKQQLQAVLLVSADCWSSNSYKPCYW